MFTVLCCSHKKPQGASYMLRWCREVQISSSLSHKSSSLSSICTSNHNRARTGRLRFPPSRNRSCFLLLNSNSKCCSRCSRQPLRPSTSQQAPSMAELRVRAPLECPALCLGCRARTTSKWDLRTRTQPTLDTQVSKTKKCQPGSR